MKLKERCIYYNTTREGYYLVLSISNMVYGRYGKMFNPTYLEAYIHQNGTGLKIKIDNIIINRDYIRNYYLNEKELEDFELVKELTDEEFYLIDIFINSNLENIDGLIDIHKDKNVSKIVKGIRYTKSEVAKLEHNILIMERCLFERLQE